MHLPPPLDRLDGPPLSLPRGLDAVSERYWRLGPRLRAVVALVAIISLAVGVAGLVGRSPWGGSVEVTVAARGLPAGHVLTEGDLRTVPWPEGLVPQDAVTGSVVGTLVGVLPEGAVLTEAHLGRGGLGALVKKGRAAVAIPLDLVAEHTLGAVLDVVGTDGRGGVRTLAQRARVLAADGDHLWLEVDTADAAAVAGAARDRSATAVVHRS